MAMPVSLLSHFAYFPRRLGAGLPRYFGDAKASIEAHYRDGAMRAERTMSSRHYWLI